MSELRQDPLTGRWVILAAGRGARPDEFGLRARATDDPESRAACPFCPGHESQTTPEIMALGRPAGAPANGPGWRMRVFPNMYPAVRPEGGDDRKAADHGWNGWAPGVGAHEVVAYATDHGAAPSDLGPGEWADLLTILQGRLRAMAEVEGIRYVSPFCNHGPEAGATLTHPHLQIIGTGEIPNQALDRARRWDEYHSREGRCLLCDMRDDERRDGARVVVDNGAGLVTAAYAGRFPFEMLLIPDEHASGLDRADRDRFEALGELLSGALGALRRIKGDCSLNLVFHGLPRFEEPGMFDRDPADIFHWHVEIFPRLSRTAGFEVGTGFSINSVLPEEAAAMLRAEVES